MADENGVQYQYMMKKKMTTEDFIEKSLLIHNGLFKYPNSIYLGSKQKIEIECIRCGPIWQLANDHLRGSRCYKCYGSKLSDSKTFIRKAKEVHKNKYNYSLTEYKRASEKIDIICSVHGPFSQIASSHLNGNGCSACAFDRKKSSLEDFMKKASAIHGIKYDYSNFIYCGANAKGDIKCVRHGIFEQAPKHHLSGAGCPSCKYLISKKEKLWLDSKNVPIRQKNIKINENKKSIKVDGFDPKTNTVYEFLGDFWHGNPKKYKLDDINPITKEAYGDLYIKTFAKIQDLKILGFNVEYIWESDYLNG